MTHYVLKNWKTFQGGLPPWHFFFSKSDWHPLPRVTWFMNGPLRVRPKSKFWFCSQYNQYVEIFSRYKMFKLGIWERSRNYRLILPFLVYFLSAALLKSSSFESVWRSNAHDNFCFRTCSSVAFNSSPDCQVNCACFWRCVHLFFIVEFWDSKLFENNKQHDQQLVPFLESKMLVFTDAAVNSMLCLHK